MSWGEMGVEVVEVSSGFVYEGFNGQVKEVRCFLRVLEIMRGFVIRFWYDQRLD